MLKATFGMNPNRTIRTRTILNRPDSRFRIADSVPLSPITLQGINSLRNVHVMLVLKGIFGGSLKPHLQTRIIRKAKNNLGGFKKALKGVSAEAPKPHVGPFCRRFGSDSGGLRAGRNSDFWSIAPTFRPVTLTFRALNPNRFTENSILGGAAAPSWPT